MEKRLVISGILLVLFGGTFGQLFRPDYYFDQGVGGWLKFYALPAEWEDAVLTCHSDGAILASPLNEEFSESLSIMMMDNKVTAAPMFTGISNIYAETQYQSMEGVPLSNLCLTWSTETYISKLASNKYCIAMYANGTVTAVSCSHYLLPFACYRKTGIELNECGPVEKGYTLNNVTGSCYKAVNELVAWSEAFKICAREGAHLAIINSQAEAKVMWELAKKVTSEPPISYLIVNIGFRSWGRKSTWITIHGQSLDEAGYSGWAPGEPLGIKDGCGTLFAGPMVDNGVLSDTECHIGAKFICEIDPKI